MQTQKKLFPGREPAPDKTAAALNRGHAASLLCGLVSLTGPVLLLLFLMLFFPGPLEKWVAAYAKTYFLKFQTVAGAPHYYFSLSETFHWWALYFKRFLIATLARVYNAAWPAFAFTAVITGLSVLLRRFAASYGRNLARPALAEPVVAFLLFLAAALAGAAPQPLALAAALTLLYALNFTFGPGLTSLAYQREKSACLLTPLSIAGVTHLLFPSALFAPLLRQTSMDPLRAQRLSTLLGRICVCLVSFPLLALLSYSALELPVSPGARLLLAEQGLYDIIIDRGANRLLVTKKGGNTGWILKLDKPALLGKFTLPTAELESIAFDPARREIYHVDRDTGKILVVDADTFKVLRSGRTPVFSTGSTKITLDKSSNRLVISWENDNLFAADRDTLACAFIGAPGNVNPLEDEANGVVYFNSESGAFIKALDLKPIKELRRTGSPAMGERMALSAARRELFVPDPSGSAVWVYATPGLALLRKIPVQFGVRPLAVDDEHGLLLTASVVTGYLDVTDLNTGARLQRHYIGKYGRIIRLDPSRRRAFITLTNSGLYMVDY